MSVLDKLLAASSVDPKCIEFELDDENTIEIFYTPMTLGELQKIQKHAKGDEVETLLYTLIFKALDAKSDPLFTIGDKMKLKKSVDLEYITSVVAQMGAGDNDLAEK